MRHLNWYLIGMIALVAAGLGYIGYIVYSDINESRTRPRLVVAIGTDSSPACILRVTDGPKPIGNTGLAAIRVVRQKYADSLDTTLFVPVGSPIKVGDLVKAQELHARTVMHQWRSMSTAIPVTPTDRDCD